MKRSPGIPAPEPGALYRYRYLWRHESHAGEIEGRKARPVLIVATIASGGDTRVLVAPITHSVPASGAGIALPPLTKQRLKLDADLSWIVTSETNMFTWPGFDLTPQPDGSWEIGKIGPKLLAQVNAALAGPPPAPRTERDDDTDLTDYRSARPSGP